MMLTNYVKTALRNLFKHKGYSLINISGLAIGMATCLLILLYVNHELSYDNYNEDAERIYRIAFSGRWGGRDIDICVAPAPMAKVILDTYPVGQLDEQTLYCLGPNEKRSLRFFILSLMLHRYIFGAN